MARPFRAVLIAALCSAAPASATTVLPVTIDQLARGSDVIVHGVVLASEPHTVDGNERHIRTRVVIDVTTLLKGARGTKSITLDLPGGNVGDWTMQIPGMPRFAVGEELVVFLERTKRSYAISGMSQGKFSVFTDKIGRRMVRRSFRGLHFAGKRPREAARTLASLLAEVRVAIRSKK